MSLFNKIKSVFNSSSDDVPDAQTIYFKNGEMYKVYPTDKESWYDARYLVSDGVKYDLEGIEALQRLKQLHDSDVEKFEIMRAASNLLNKFWKVMVADRKSVV